jgi:hypothetical protein
LPAWSREVSVVTDLDLLLAAVELHDWDVVLLDAREKRPPLGCPWAITGDADVAEAHAKAGGNLGIVAATSGLAILDADDLELFGIMCEELGAPGLPTVRTGSGKIHVYTSWLSGLPAKLLWRGRKVGEIQRGPRQQVVAPGSIHPSGQPYRWLLNPLAWDPEPLPRSWRAYLAEPAPEPKPNLGSDLPSVSDLQRAALTLPGARWRGDDIKFQCPECQAEGHDKHEDNARLFANGRWGCAYSPADRVHRRGIARALGVLA